MRRLFLAGVPMIEIGRIVGRGEASVYRHTADLSRPKPPPRSSGKKAPRNDRILAMVLRGMSRHEIARRLDMAASAVGYAVAHHPKVLAMLRSGAKPAAVAKRFRLELSTVLRILRPGKKVPRTRAGSFDD